MGNGSISRRDLMMAKICAGCLVCRRARARQEGLAFEFVKGIEGRLCPFCRAYERVYGKKAHEPVS